MLLLTHKPANRSTPTYRQALAAWAQNDIGRHVVSPPGAGLRGSCPSVLGQDGAMQTQLIIESLSLSLYIYIHTHTHTHTH